MISQRKSLFFFVLRMVFHIFAKDKLRGEVKFAGLDELKAELARNAQTARQVISDGDLAD